MTRRARIAAVTTVLLLALTGTAQAQSKPTVVLVHGAWADASGWNGVATRLVRKGYRVIAPANPLRSLHGDAEYVASVLAQTPGPIVLVGHSYGGAVITNAATGNANVKALVYIAGFIPEVGEDTLTLAGADSLIAKSIEFKPYPPFGQLDVDVYIKQDMFRTAFAADLPRRVTEVMAATQRPASLAAGGARSESAAWKTIPSWALIPRQDRTIVPSQQRMMAKRAGARVTEAKASHVVMMSKPGLTTKVIEKAVRATD